MNLALLGFGTVGSHFYALAQEQPGFTVTHVLSRRPRPQLSCTVTADFDDIVRDSAVDVVVEAMGGIEPARSCLTAAMRAGKHVVTANKALMCAHYDELTALARAYGTALRCTAAAGGGIPWLDELSRMAAMDELDTVEGIMNGTTNFILDAMTAHGADYPAALSAAQALGYAEADPTADVDGFDAQRKLILSANVAFGISLRGEVPCIGIRSITAADVDEAHRHGLVFRLIARAQRSGSGVCAYVCPTLYPDGAAQAQIRAADNLMLLHARRVGRQSFSGAGAGGWPTASNLLRDCMAIRGGASGFYTDRALPCPVSDGDAEETWLCRVKGAYFTRRCSAFAAFAAHRQDKAADPLALTARLAVEEGGAW